jgi:hypothetical protein
MLFAMGLIADSSFDEPLKRRLIVMRDCVAKKLSTEADCSVPPAGLHDAIEQAICNLARAGQTDLHAIERYAASWGRAFLQRNIS